MAMSNLEKVRAYRERKKAAKAEAIAALAATVGAGSKLARLAQLILEAQSLAAEINAEMVADLRSQPVSRDTVRLLDSLEGKEMRIAFAKVDLPV